jgi:hypothetical protein
MMKNSMQVLFWMKEFILVLADFARRVTCVIFAMDRILSKGTMQQMQDSCQLSPSYAERHICYAHFLLYNVRPLRYICTMVIGHPAPTI